MKYEPVFYSVSDDWSSRWQLLREFIRRWHGIELKDAGHETALAQEEEKKLGFRLPPSFREWISLASELLEKGKFDIFRDDYEVTHLKDLSATTLLLQSEGDFYWAVRNQNLGFEDPPVEGYWLDHRQSPERFVWFESEAAHITSFVLGHLIYCLYGEGGGCNVEVEVGTSFLDDMKASFDTHSVFDHLSIFEKPNMIAVLTPSPFEGRHYLLVEIWKNISRSEIPKCIHDRIQGGGGFHGMLLPK